MSRPFIVLGDSTSHGGTVVGSTQLTDSHGKRLARVGDQVTCPKKGHGTTVIISGDPTMIVDGAPVARHGDRCACGAILISSQVVSRSVEGAITSATTAHGPARSTEQAPASTTLSNRLTEEDLEQYFEIVDAHTGEAAHGMRYKLSHDDTVIADGAPLLSGQTRRVQMSIYRSQLDFTAWIPMESHR